MTDRQFFLSVCAAAAAITITPAAIGMALTAPQPVAQAVETASAKYTFSPAQIRQCEYDIRTTLVRPDSFKRQLGWSKSLEITGELFFSYENHVGMREYTARACSK
jgi:hypothetical protein